MKYTIEDVAKSAGVSITTVSRVINNNYPVKKSTRIKVENAIESLNFKPNTLARGLIQKKTNTIGVVVPSITNLFFPEVVKGIESFMKQYENTLFLCETKENAKDEKLLIDRLMDHQVDGVIAIGPTYENVKNGYFEKITEEIPVILVNGYHRGIRCNFVLTDEEMGTLEALNYLFQCGHQNIAFLRGAKSYSYDLKEEIFFNEMNQKGFPIYDENKLVIPTGNSVETVDLAREAVKKRYAVKAGNAVHGSYQGTNITHNTDELPTAIFCCNDWMANGAISALKGLGLSVPRDVSVIGFDNIVISQITEPKLTTVDQGMFKLGQGAASLLLELIEGKGKQESLKKIILETKLIIRESVMEQNIKEAGI